MKTIFRLFILMSLSLLFWACPKNPCPDGVDAVMRDLTGLDGCKWVIELPGGERLEPVNLHELDFTPVDNMPVRVSYTVAEDMFSICMVGPMVRVSCITSR